MEDYIKAYEYEKNVNPTLQSVPIIQKNIIDCSYGMTFIDFSDIYKVNYKCTSPNLLASFIKIKPNDFLDLNNESDNNFANATSHLFFVIKGNCEFNLDDENFKVSNGDILVTPTFNKLVINNHYNEELQIYYINDSPLINYLGSRSTRQIFKTALYSKDFLMSNLFSLSDPNNNRKGILLSNKDTEKIGTNTISPVLWALYNELPPNTIQRPHKHNSVALDFCISCSDSDNIYTLIGDELDKNGNIVNPIKVNWKQGEMFTTPPTLWHSHNNKGNTLAYILPIQDAGLLLYQRILGIVLN
jgi:gentisate 1,2-dioxygenase